MSSIGERLKEERERLGYSQSDFAAMGSKTKKTQIEWEKGEAYPNASFMAAIAAAGADVQYILTGQHGTPAMTAEQERAGYVVRVLSPAEAVAVDALRGSGQVPEGFVVAEPG